MPNHAETGPLPLVEPFVSGPMQHNITGRKYRAWRIGVGLKSWSYRVRARKINAIRRI